MRKIFILAAFVFSSLCLYGCAMPETEIINHDVEKIELDEYQKVVEVGEEYDEESVFVKATFKNGTKKYYSGDDLSFDYGDFDSNVEGEYTITVKVKALNMTVDLDVLVKTSSFRVLIISNSYGDDTVQWVHEICNDLGVEFTIANLFIGGCVLSQHLENLKNDAKAYEYVSYNSKAVGDKWVRYKNTSISEALCLEDWNYVVLQQGSHESGLANTYDYMDAIMDEVLELKDDVKFIWNMTWAYQQNSNHTKFGTYNNDQMTMYNAIVDAVKTKVLTNERIETIIPNGTAIQNARTSLIGDTLCRDEYCHLSLNLGRYIAGLTMVGALTGVDIRKVEYSPNLSEQEKEIAIESAYNAINDKFNITKSKHSAKETIKVLMIANSYGDDTAQWVHDIADSLGVDVKISNLYIGSCTLSTHLNNLNNNAASYEYSSYNKKTKTWSRLPKTSIAQALSYDDWDYVSLQQASHESGQANTYDLLNAVMAKVLSIKNDVKFIWNMTWAYQQNFNHPNFGNYGNDQMTMYNAIVNAVKTKVLTNDRIEFVVPNGTAIQNVRTSFVGDTLCRDVYCHLSYDYGRYIAGLTMVKALTGVDINKIKFSPGLNDSFKLVAVEAVNNAIANPFAVTQSKYKENQSTDVVSDVFAGKTFVPTAEAKACVISWTNSPYFGYENLTDGKMAESEGRFSTTSNGFARATIDLGRSYSLDTIRFYDYLQNSDYMGSSMKIEVYSNGTWTTVIDCTSNSAILENRVSYGAGPGGGWVDFNLNGVLAEQVRFTIDGTYNGKSISIYEIKGFGKVAN